MVPVVQRQEADRARSRLVANREVALERRAQQLFAGGLEPLLHRRRVELALGEKLLERRKHARVRFVGAAGEELGPALLALTAEDVCDYGVIVTDVTDDPEQVAGEVKTRENLEREDDLVELSKRLEGNKDWHLELVVINPRKLHSEKKGGRAAITWDEITNKANEANELLAQGYKDAALLLAWIAVEGAMRQIAQDEQLASRSRSTSELIKSLAVYGLITKNDYKNIESAFQARNEIAHGYSSHRTGHPMAERVLKILPKLEKERANTPR